MRILDGWGSVIIYEIVFLFAISRCVILHGVQDSTLSDLSSEHSLGFVGGICIALSLM